MRMHVHVFLHVDAYTCMSWDALITMFCCIWNIRVFYFIIPKKPFTGRGKLSINIIIKFLEKFPSKEMWSSHYKAKKKNCLTLARVGFQLL